MDDDADAKMILTAPPPENWKRRPGRPRITWLNTVQRNLRGFTAFSLPGQFAPRSESANITLANSLPGTFAPGSEMARELAIHSSYIYTPRKFQGTKRPGSERTRKRIGPGAKRLGTGLSKICRDAGTDARTVRQRRKTPRLA